MQKEKFCYSGRTGIAFSKGFQEKGLAKYAVNIGNICDFSCTFCYVPSISVKQDSVQKLLKRGHQLGDFSSYRKRENVLDTVRNDLQGIRRGDTAEVFFCTTCDPCSTDENVVTTAQAMKLILEGSNLQIRVLSKSTRIWTLASMMESYKDRVIYSLSTGTSCPLVSTAIEGDASPINDRVETLHRLQDNGFRTYGMICPVLPSEVNRAAMLIDQVRPERCEHVWAEALNIRGRSLVLTLGKLLEAKAFGHAEQVSRVMGNQKNWIEYSQNLFLAFQAEMRKRHQLGKLRFCQYVSKYDREFFESQEGAVCILPPVKKERRKRQK